MIAPCGPGNNDAFFVRIQPAVEKGKKSPDFARKSEHEWHARRESNPRLPLRSTENRLIHAVLRCYAMSLNPLKYKAFRRIPCSRVLSGFVPFFRLFWRPVSKMLAKQLRETNLNELWFESKPWFHATTLGNTILLPLGVSLRDSLIIILKLFKSKSVALPNGLQTINLS